MMRSLWAGVSGLQAHQIAMDIEGNNIANVNTTGFKYSRANFSDLLSQTAKIATAPQGSLGGKNSMQIGLGTQIASVTKIFKQGSIQTTDKNTDLAIQGDGFFVVSPDGGKTYKYSRNGDFSFDALGNFVEGNGYIIQGWKKDDTTGQIDATAPIRNITIPPGLTTPANDTGYITLKANLDSGADVGTKKSPIYTLDQYGGWYDANNDGIQGSDEIHNENDKFNNQFDVDKVLVERGLDMGSLFNANGEAFNLRKGEGIWMSYAEASYTTTVATPTWTGNLNIQINGEDIAPSTASTSISDVINAINDKSKLTGVTAELSGTDQIKLVNTNRDGTTSKMKNIDLVVNATNTVNGFTGGNITVNTAYQYAYNASTASSTQTYDPTDVREFTTTEDLRKFIQTDARLHVDYTGDGLADKNDGVVVIVNEAGQFEISNPSGDAFNANDGDIISSPTTLTAITAFPAAADFKGGFTVGPGGVTLPIGTVIDGTPLAIATAYAAGATIGTPAGGGVQLPALVGVSLPVNTVLNGVVNTTTDEKQELYLSVTGLTRADATNPIGQNAKFLTSMSALQGALSTGSAIRSSQGIYAASHASSIDVYDSLGSKHTVRFEFTKTGYSEWSIVASVPVPGKINYSGSGPENIVSGYIGFNSDGSLSTTTLTNLTYTANNGSTANQNVELRFGTIGQFDGMTSFDSDSNTSGISQDGYPGGDLAGIRVDETGTLIGSFTNGRSFGLAQVGMARFTNNEGLESDGGNTFVQTSNSGDPIIGQAAVGGRGFVQASSLEMSNVDLSRSLTQLIVIQRGYQANSKTITTADQLLQTLLQLKQ